MQIPGAYPTTSPPCPSNSVGDRRFHPLEEEQPADQHQPHHHCRPQHGRTRRVPASGQPPAESINHSPHGVQPIQPAPPLRPHRPPIPPPPSHHPTLPPPTNTP